MDDVNVLQHDFQNSHSQNLLKCSTALSIDKGGGYKYVKLILYSDETFLYGLEIFSLSILK